MQFSVARQNQNAVCCAGNSFKNNKVEHIEAFLANIQLIWTSALSIFKRELVKKKFKKRKIKRIGEAHEKNAQCQ